MLFLRTRGFWAAETKAASWKDPALIRRAQDDNLWYKVKKNEKKQNMQKQQHCWRWGGLQRAALPSEAALRSVCFFHYLAGGLRLFGAGDFWQPGEEGGAHSLHERHTCNSGKTVSVLLWFAWAYCRCLRRALLRSSLMYSAIRPWAKRRKSSVGKKHIRRKTASLCQIARNKCAILLPPFGQLWLCMCDKE